MQNPQTPAPPVWTVLFKAHRPRSRWQVVGTAATYDAAAEIVAGTDRKGGDFWITDRPEHQPKEPTCRP